MKVEEITAGCKHRAHVESLREKGASNVENIKGRRVATRKESLTIRHLEQREVEYESVGSVCSGGWRPY